MCDSFSGPPKRLFIADSDGNYLSGKIGPFDEYSNISLTCICEEGIVNFEINCISE